MRKRKNPSKGLPHQDPNLLKAAPLFERGYNIPRAELQISEEVIPSGEIQGKVIQKLQHAQSRKDRDAEISQFKGVDFSRYFENLASFKLDIDAYLKVVKQHLGDSEDVRKTYSDYLAISRKLKELVEIFKDMK